MNERHGVTQSADQPLFCVHLEDALPPLPGAPVRISPARPTLEDLLGHLLATAACNVIPSPSRSPDAPSIQTSFAALEGASASFEVAPGISLAPFFWTHAAPLRQGEVATVLHDASARSPAQGFLALYAADVRSPLLYSEHGIPLRVRDAIEVPLGAHGPFLVLVVCTLSETGEAIAVKGYAQPIYHARRFVPVKSELERDLLRVLEHLQVVADAHGVEVDIIRHLQRLGAAQQPGPLPSAASYSLVVRDGVRPERQIALSVGARTDAAGVGKGDDFHVDRGTLSNGAFVA